MNRVSTARLVVAGLLLALLLAGVVSHYASRRPDGLNRVAADHGFAGHAAASRTSGSPLAGYQTKGVHNGRLSGGLAGVAGSVIVLLGASGLVLVARRRRTSAGSED